MLAFNSRKYDFAKISESIRHFYPISISKEDSSYFSYPGIIDLEKLIVDNIHNESNLKSRWAALMKEIQDQLQKPVIGTIYGQVPSFSAFTQLETSSLDNLTRTKELHFYVSLLGPFYTIIGQDNNIVKVGEKHFGTTNYLTVSPESEYTDAFKLVADKIENLFSGYRFVPYGIYHQKVEGLHLPYTDAAADTIFHALFTDNTKLTAYVMGDWGYGYDQWINADFDGIETIVILSPPNQWNSYSVTELFSIRPTILKTRMLPITLVRHPVKFYLVQGSFFSKIENDIKEVRLSTLKKIVELGLGGQLELSIKL